MEIAVNTFNDGLNLDTNAMVTPSTVLTDCLNGTLLTYNGNEQVLQNDMGNGKVETAKLPDGYVPVGMKEHGGIIYVASYNPETNRSQIGSFPSPERNIEDLMGANSTFSLPEKPNEFTQIALCKNKIVPGNQLYVQLPVYNPNNPVDNIIQDITPNFNQDGTPYTGQKRKYSIELTTMSSDGVLIDQTSDFKPLQYDNTDDYYWFGVGDDEPSSISDSLYSVYRGLPGKPYIKVTFNGIIDQDVDVAFSKNPTNPNSITLKVTGDYTYNCPDNEENGFQGVIIYYKYFQNIQNQSIDPKDKTTYVISTNPNTYAPTYIQHQKILSSGTINPSITEDGDYIIRVLGDASIECNNIQENSAITYAIVPYFEYEDYTTGDIEPYEIWERAVTNTVLISDIASGKSTLNAWKYYHVSENEIMVTWGMKSYPGNQDEVPKNIKFTLIPANSAVFTQLPLLPNCNGELQNSELPYYNMENKDDVSCTRIQPNTQNDGLPLTNDSYYRCKITSYGNYNVLTPEVRTGYNGVFTEIFTNENDTWLEDTSYIVEISYEVKFGETTYKMYYYRWLFTTNLYNDQYYNEEMDFINITPKTSIPFNINAEATYTEESETTTSGDQIQVYLNESEVPSGTKHQYINSNYTYNIAPKLSFSWDGDYPVTFNTTTLTNDLRVGYEYIIIYANSSLSITSPNFSSNYYYKFSDGKLYTASTDGSGTTYSESDSARDNNAIDWYTNYPGPPTQGQTAYTAYVLKHKSNEEYGIYDTNVYQKIKPSDWILGMPNQSPLNLNFTYKNEVAFEYKTTSEGVDTYYKKNVTIDNLYETYQARNLSESDLHMYYIQLSTEVSNKGDYNRHWWCYTVYKHNGDEAFPKQVSETYYLDEDDGKSEKSITIDIESIFSKLDAVDDKITVAVFYYVPIFRFNSTEEITITEESDSITQTYSANTYYAMDWNGGNDYISQNPIAFNYVVRTLDGSIVFLNPDYLYSGYGNTNGNEDADLLQLRLNGQTIEKFVPNSKLEQWLINNVTNHLYHNVIVPTEHYRIEVSSTGTIINSQKETYTNYKHYSKTSGSAFDAVVTPNNDPCLVLYRKWRNKTKDITKAKYKNLYPASDMATGNPYSPTGILKNVAVSVGKREIECYIPELFGNSRTAIPDSVVNETTYTEIQTTDGSTVVAKINTVRQSDISITNSQFKLLANDNSQGINNLGKFFNFQVQSYNITMNGFPTEFEHAKIGTASILQKFVAPSFSALIKVSEYDSNLQETVNKLIQVNDELLLGDSDVIKCIKQNGTWQQSLVPGLIREKVGSTYHALFGISGRTLPSNTVGLIANKYTKERVTGVYFFVNGPVSNCCDLIDEHYLSN